MYAVCFVPRKYDFCLCGEASTAVFARYLPLPAFPWRYFGTLTHSLFSPNRSSSSVLPPQYMSTIRPNNSFPRSYTKILLTPAPQNTSRPGRRPAWLLLSPALLLYCYIGGGIGKSYFLLFFHSFTHEPLPHSSFRAGLLFRIVLVCSLKLGQSDDATKSGASLPQSPSVLLPVSPAL
ncbi:hypothetical protein BGX38DRAFT_801580 [Terfezia claveryi]|nr:hypothetical protein BGX38DRAFT_801580 [Terfezia claveryi]